MPTRYVCKECSEISKKEEKCSVCGDEMYKINLPWGLENLAPYIFAALAGTLLTVGFFSDRTFLIWFTFPFIGAGLLYDHLYEKQVEELIKRVIREKK